MRDDDTFIPIDPDLAPSDTGEPAVGRRRLLQRRRETRARPDVLAVIAIGGMVGAAARFKLSEVIHTNPGHFPWATFWTNMSGSLVLGFLLVVLLEKFPPTQYLRPFLATGILGAFTTMSTFTVETALLVKDHHASTAVVYGIGSMVVGVLLAYIGIAAGRLVPHRHPPQVSP
jgi:CrcB protein